MLLCVSMIALIPGQPAAAQSSVPQPIDNAQGDFADGVFQRVSIGPDNRSTLTPADGEVADQAGVVKLSPAGVLNPWDSIPGDLPADAAVSSPGVTALGNRIYVIGGKPLAGNATDATWWATVAPQEGNLIETGGNTWLNKPMTATKAIFDSSTELYYPECKAVTGKRARVGVASLDKGNNSGFIYVIGGVADIPGCTYNFSTPIVQRATVATNGTITWSTLTSALLPSPKVPTDNGTDSARTLGIDGTSTAIVRARDSNGTDHYYLYVIGGKSLYVNGPGSLSPDELTSRVLKAVYYTEIDYTTGDLKHPLTGSPTGVWKRTADFPSAADKGIWDATATAVNVVVGDQLKSAIFVAGGSLTLGGNSDPVVLNPYIYRADIGDKGALTWKTTPGNGGIEQVSLSPPRRGLTSITYNNKLYMIGGTTTNDNSGALNAVPTAFYDDDLNMIKIDTDFVIGPGPADADKVLNTNNDDQGRYNLGAALVRAETPTGAIPDTLNSAWVFAIGGSNSSGQPSNKVYRGKIGGDETADDVKRAPEGWYYSGAIKSSFEFGSENKLARVLAIHWATDIDRTTGSPNADIEIQFRKKITGSGECTGDDGFKDTDPWSSSADGFASSPLYSKSAISGAMYNTVDMTTLFGSDTTASCLQYRAHLMQDATGSGIKNPKSTPMLLSVYIEKVIAGNAELNIPTGGFSVTTTNNRLSSVTMNMRNLNLTDQAATLSADRARYPAAETSVYVNLCMTYSPLTESTAPSLTLPDPNAFQESDKTLCRYYAEIFTYEIQSGTVIDLLKPDAVGNSRWHDNANNYQTVSDIRSAFSTTGNYRIGMILDTGNNVPEGTTGETNNRSETITFRIEGSPINVVMLPLVAR
ncbi:hypothetical protein K2Z83_07980 [Oscillochloris sp. ZM17-4]|uniref:hypothetical protein n=1 Tax=Oscillochloris sp. ZM17-4 TaxID=2866714 RepID=UPI001C72D01D|nr:hypothetical protein [Oscillochloris sp. ZM17-4]MBX0327614.1 hypothetical protein [Oscillochloris sp. ZM17-4]